MSLHRLITSLSLLSSIYHTFMQNVGKASEFASVKLVFHVPMLKKCIDDLDSILRIEGLAVDENLSYEEVPVQILNRQKFDKQQGGFFKGVMEEPPS